MQNEHDPLPADWLAKARTARELDAAGKPWPAWSTGETLAVALILRRADLLADLDYTPVKALMKLSDDIGADPAQVRTLVIDLREQV
ncbi:hypothetical protein AB0M47_20875 [Hamadaea sp. NPDC051192]|uniref:hypothetical protein n=1 Tax=Hamadaea sp. NPDC051192 TaxID=3154940 RepID=UPI00341810BE